MSAKVWVGIGAAIAIVVLLFLTICAQGAPSAPTASTGATLNPSTAQSVQVTLKTQFYSLVAPNTIYQIGAKFIYSVVETGGGGNPVILATNLTASATSISVGSNNLCTMIGAFTVTTVAVCSSPLTCGTAPENLTITATADVSTYLAFWTSPTSTIVFSNVATYTNVPAVVAPNPSSYYLELYLPITGIFFVGLLAFTIMRPNDYSVVLTFIAGIAIPVEFILWAYVL